MKSTKLTGTVHWPIAILIFKDNKIWCCTVRSSNFKHRFLVWPIQHPCSVLYGACKYLLGCPCFIGAVLTTAVHDDKQNAVCVFRLERGIGLIIPINRQRHHQSSHLSQKAKAGLQEKEHFGYWGSSLNSLSQGKNVCNTKVQAAGKLHSLIFERLADAEKKGNLLTPSPIPWDACWLQPLSSPPKSTSEWQINPSIRSESSSHLRGTLPIFQWQIPLHLQKRRKHFAQAYASHIFCCVAVEESQPSLSVWELAL